MESEIFQLREKVKALETEVSVLKQQQYDINKAKELYLKIFEEFPALIWRSRLDKLCDYFNKTWLEFTGRTMEQEFGNGWAEGVHPDDFDFCLKTYVEAFDKQEAFLMEYRMKNRFGEYRWIRDFGRPFFDLDNSFLGYIGSCYDITEIKDNEQKLIELNATKDKFFSIIAHDLINPFNSILGLAEILNKKHSTFNADEIETITARLVLSATNTFNLLENLLEWSRTQSNTIPFEPREIEFTELGQKVIESLASSADSKSVELICFASEKIALFADPNMLKVILRNLISNAIKFSNPNSSISFYAERKETHALITVSDKGIGIDDQRLKSLFDITQKRSTSGTLNEKGTGLGLIICKEFVEKHGGKIWAKSKPGEGTSFFFTIPCKH